MINFLSFISSIKTCLFSTSFYFKAVSTYSTSQVGLKRILEASQSIFKSYNPSIEIFYSFLSPLRLLVIKQTNYELQVKLQIIQCMSTNSLEKVFHATDFLDQFNVSTQKQANIKKLIVESFHQLQQDNRIKNKFKLVTKSGKVQETNKLVPLRIGQSKIIRFYEIL